MPVSVASRSISWSWKARVAGFLCGRLPLPVIPVTAAHGGGCVVADGQPRLGEVAHLQVVGCSGAAHLGRDPPWIDGVAEDIWPAARKGQRERGYVELGLGVRLGGAPGPLCPVDIPEGPGAALMHPAAEVVEPIWSV